MAYRIAQFRFYGYGSENNYCPNESKITNPRDKMGDALINGSIFNNFTPINKITIETSKKIRVCFNKNMYPISINNDRIFVLEPSDNGLIFKINFCWEDLTLYFNSNTDYLIINIFYELNEEIKTEE